MPHVEQKIEAARGAEFVAKANDLDLKRYAILKAAECLHDQAAQRVNRVIGGVDYQIRKFANILSRSSLAPDRGEQTLAIIGGMRPASF